MPADSQVSLQKHWCCSFSVTFLTSRVPMPPCFLCATVPRFDRNNSSEVKRTTCKKVTQRTVYEEPPVQTNARRRKERKQHTEHLREWESAADVAVEHDNILLHPYDMTHSMTTQQFESCLFHITFPPLSELRGPRELQSLQGHLP